MQKNVFYLVVDIELEFCVETTCCSFLHKIHLCFVEIGNSLVRR